MAAERFFRTAMIAISASYVALCIFGYLAQ